jgi:hypothetical protein
MHGVVVRVRINDPEKAIGHLHEEVVPRASHAPGFVAGYWVRGEGGTGNAVIVFESEDAAREAASRVSPAPDGSTEIENVEVGEVLAHA